MKRFIIKFVIFSGLIVLCSLFANAQSGDKYPNIALNKPVTASSEADGYPASNAVNGMITRESKWMTRQGVLPPHILEINLQKYYSVNRIVVHSGIPEEERTPGESLQAAGFWSVKHFRLQYWDDANWTDIPGTEITENRRTSVDFDISPAFMTFKIRFIAFDGEPINLMEIEIFGVETKGQSLPVPDESVIVPEKEYRSGESKSVSISISPEVKGKTMQYVGYNQAYYLPGSNTSGWLEYSCVNSLRVWTSLTNYVPVSAVQTDTMVLTLADFENRKSLLRSDPENSRFIDWSTLKKIYSQNDFTGTNFMEFDYVLEESKKLGIDILLQINERRFSDEWSHKWQQWQRFYALAYYAAREGNVSKFAMQNEPNHAHSGPMSIEEWLTGMRIVSDAIRCAVEDVNRKYGKTLLPQFVGPVTAGTNTDWWTKVVRNVRTDYKGETINYDLIDIFSTHSYNSPAVGYASRVKSIRELIRENHPEGKEIPVVYTEIGRWMNAYLIDKEETMDSPSLFTEWAGIYTNNMLNGSYGMWAFKFASNTSSTYPRGIKSGHHFIWNGKRVVEDAYTNLALNKPVSSNTCLQNSSLQHVTDGDVTDNSSWYCDSDVTEKFLEIDLLKEELIGSAIIYTGSAYGVFTGPDRVRNYKLQYWNGYEWNDIPGAAETDCKYVQVLQVFNEPVKTRRIRYVLSDEGPVKIREIKLFEYGKGPDTAKESYDISGIHRTGEVVRLFAKGFKDQRDLLNTTVSSPHSGLDVYTSFDPLTGNYHLWLVQRTLFNYNLSIDLSELKITPGQPVIAEIVGPDHFGEAAIYTHVDEQGKANIALPAQSVMLLTIPAVQSGNRTLTTSVSDAFVRGGPYAGKNYGRKKTISVSLDASNPSNNQISFIHFDLNGIEKGENNLTLLGLNGVVDQGNEPMRVHVYGFPSENWNEKRLTWKNAPNLDIEEALIRNVGREVFIAGQIPFDNQERYHYLDVSRHIKNHPKGITFVVIRETRHMGDYGDKGRNLVIKSRESGKKPVLINYSNIR